MNVEQAYNVWAEQYDTNQNKTRDLEAISLRETLSHLTINRCLEMGCGTGKNTEWLVKKAKTVLSADFSAEMLAKAKEKVQTENVQFVQADMTKNWDFTKNLYDLVTFSLVLEHIEDLEAIFRKVAAVTTPNAYVYVGELHPFKQYSGSKARFDTEGGQQVVTCFNHHVSEFTQAAKMNGFDVFSISEYFDDNDKANVPRILTILFKKQ